jgi:hypothetical protein
MSIKGLIAGILGESSESNEDSIEIRNHTVLKRFIADPDNTFLISFPRTGSHWLRMLMELYFERPSLVRVFYYPKCTDYLTLHTHDMNLDVERRRVVYLYREPIATIYSQLNYYKENIHDRQRIAYWSDLYGRHLDKWLHSESFTVQKTVLRYERLVADISSEFAKMTKHFNETLDVAHLQLCANETTKEATKRKTTHDAQVVNLNDQYEITRQEFSNLYGQYVWKMLLLNREHLRNDFVVSSSQISL